MKILALGDIHGDTVHIEKLAQKALKENVDLVILTGDITDFNSSTENLVGPFKNVGKKVLIIPGNHEPLITTDFLAELYDIKNLHGYSVRYKDIGIFGAGGSSVVGPSPLIPEEDMFNLLKKGFDKVKYLEKKIMVTHEHPAGSTIEKFTQFFPGSDAIKEAIDKFHPNILICSHVHEAEGLEEKIGTTRVISVGKKGKIIDI
jgi:uncharacterized protein